MANENNYGNSPYLVVQYECSVAYYCSTVKRGEGKQRLKVSTNKTGQKEMNCYP